MRTQYCQEVYPDDSLFEDTKVFEEDIMCMKLQDIPEERIIVLGQDSELQRLEWRRKCFKARPSEEKNDKSEKEKIDDSSDIKKSLPKETSLPRLKDLEVGKQIPLGFNHKAIVDPDSKRLDLKDIHMLSS